LLFIVQFCFLHYSIREWHWVNDNLGHLGY
jgi:hypothetical protein